MSLVAPSPLRAISWVRYSLDFQKARFKLAWWYGPSQAVRHQDDSVARARVGVYAHGIKGSVNHSFEHRP